MVRAVWQVLEAQRRTMLAGLVLVLLVTAPALASACTLFAAPSAKEAKLKVFFTRFESEDTSGGKYKKCRIVKKKDEKTETFFITPFRQDANVVVHRSNWPK
jgi:outer membrane lipoprotein-sorting protein